MKNRLLFSVFLIALIITEIGFQGTELAQAQTAGFPAGCGSALGYSASTGLPCNGTSVPTAKPMPGCTTALGYSATTGSPCSGNSTLLLWLAGCTSTLGYSAESGEPCNGTAVATLATPPPTTTPGFPTTGAGGDAFRNIMLLLSSLLIAVWSSVALVRHYRTRRG